LLVALRGHEARPSEQVCVVCSPTAADYLRGGGGKEGVENNVRYVFCEIFTHARGPGGTTHANVSRLRARAPHCIITSPRESARLGVAPPLAVASFAVGGPPC
jgi:hypothetical protein